MTAAPAVNFLLQRRAFMRLEIPFH